MKNPEMIESFIRDLFEFYNLDYGKYFYDYTEDDECVEIPMMEAEKLDLTMVEQAAEILGEDVDALMSCDDKRVLKWARTNPYAMYKQGFEYACKRGYYDKNFDTTRLMEVIFDEDLSDCYRRKYDYEDVKKRLVVQLKEYDKTIPGTYHAGARMRNLHIYTGTFCHYKDMDKLIKTFFRMVERAEELFFKALDNGLETDEIKEYNIIVSLLGIQDRSVPRKGELHYSMLQKLIPVYKQENKLRFLDYVMLDADKRFEPWRCIEFIENASWVQQYVNIVPQAKKLMREHAMSVANFDCSFVWEDAAELNYVPVSDNEIAEMGNMLRFIRTRDQFGGLEPTIVYVPKTEEELGEDVRYADMLKKLSGPAGKGGIKVTAGVGVREHELQSMIRRISALGGSSHE